MMSIAHFNATREVSDNYAMHVSELLADGDETILNLTSQWKITHDKKIIEKLKEYYKNNA